MTMKDCFFFGVIVLQGAYMTLDELKIVKDNKQIDSSAKLDGD